MLDFHAHLLPGVDDGSKNVDESRQMLKRMHAQGIKQVVAPPHFYANDESLDSFLTRRAAAYGAIEHLTERPQILLGAEVRYYEGISRMPDLKKLCVQDSRLMLLEMPFRLWSEYAVKEVVDIACQGRIIPVIAHVERYLFIQKKGVAERLLQNGVLFQVNADFLTEWKRRRKALRMLKRGEIHFIGSDCHNLTDRAPKAGEGYALLEKKFGREFVMDFGEFGKRMLANGKH